MEKMIFQQYLQMICHTWNKLQVIYHMTYIFFKMKTLLHYLIKQNVSWGPGPRAAQALMLTVRAAALLDGRLAPSAEDIRAMAIPVLEHRMALSFAARARGESIHAIINHVADQVTQVAAAA